MTQMVPACLSFVAHCHLLAVLAYSSAPQHVFAMALPCAQSLLAGSCYSAWPHQPETSVCPVEQTQQLAWCES